MMSDLAQVFFFMSDPDQINGQTWGKRNVCVENEIIQRDWETSEIFNQRHRTQDGSVSLTAYVLECGGNLEATFLWW